MQLYGSLVVESESHLPWTTAIHVLLQMLHTHDTCHRKISFGMISLTQCSNSFLFYVVYKSFGPLFRVDRELLP